MTNLPSTHNFETCTACQRHVRLVHGDRARPLNRELGWLVRDAIVAHPDHHDQSTWFNAHTDDKYAYTDDEDAYDVYVEARRRQYGKQDVLNRCGTTACAAGWTVLLRGYRIDDFGNVFRPDGSEVVGAIDGLARDELGLTHSEARRIFHADDDTVLDEIDAVFGTRPEVDA